MNKSIGSFFTENNPPLPKNLWVIEFPENIFSYGKLACFNRVLIYLIFFGQIRVPPPTLFTKLIKQLKKDKSHSPPTS